MSFIATTLFAGFVSALGLLALLTLIGLLVDAVSPPGVWLVIGVFSLGLLIQSAHYAITGSFLK